jgi:hypothetical protein
LQLPAIDAAQFLAILFLEAGGQRRQGAGITDPSEGGMDLSARRVIERGTGARREERLDGRRLDAHAGIWGREPPRRFVIRFQPGDQRHQRDGAMGPSVGLRAPAMPPNSTQRASR